MQDPQDGRPFQGTDQLGDQIHQPRRSCVAAPGHARRRDSVQGLRHRTNQQRRPVESAKRRRLETQFWELHNPCGTNHTTTQRGITANWQEESSPWHRYTRICTTQPRTDSSQSGLAS
jgi:hypothetical protein